MNHTRPSFLLFRRPPRSRRIQQAASTNRGLALVPAAVLILAAPFNFLTLLAAASPPSAGTISTVAGNGKLGFTGDTGPAIQAALNFPWGMVVDKAGNLFFADALNHRVRKVSPSGLITTVAGGGTKTAAAAEGGLATEASLGNLTGLALDGESNLFVGDNNGRIWRISPSGIIATFAGNGKIGFSGDKGPATQASLTSTVSLVIDRDGSLVFVDTWNHRVRKVSPDGTISTVAGGGNPADGLGDGGPATQARLKAPYNVALDEGGNLFIADFVNDRVRMVRPDGVILTVAGGGTPADGLGDGGLATQARLDRPVGLVVDAGGNLFIADHRHLRVRKVGPAGIITTVAGTGQAGFSGEGGLAAGAQLHAPGTLVLDRAGNLFIGDALLLTPDGRDGTVFNNRIREVFGVAVPE